jgi:membrane protein required for beta-lactamase induction
MKKKKKKKQLVFCFRGFVEELYHLLKEASLFASFLLLLLLLEFYMLVLIQMQELEYRLLYLNLFENLCRYCLGRFHRV